MPSIGIRCFPDKFSFVVLNGTKSKPVLVDSGTRTFPKNLDRANELLWFSREAQELVERHHPEQVSFKGTEPGSRMHNMERAEMEGVLQVTLLTHTANITCRRLLNKQMKAALRAQCKQTELATLLSAVGLEAVSSANLADAALTALCGLPGNSAGA